MVRSYAWCFATGSYRHVHLITLEEKQNELECVSSRLLHCEWPYTNSTVLERKGGKEERRRRVKERSSFQKSTYKTPGRQELCYLRCLGLVFAKVLSASNLL